METAIILIVFVGGPLAFFGFIIGAAIYRARQNKKVGDAAAKYLRS